MKFILTKELGRLTKWLRILGFDAEYFIQDNSSSLIIKALREERIILTRNKKITKSRAVKVINIASELVKTQLGEVLKTLQIKPDSSMIFTRCILCNEKLKDIVKEKIEDRVPEYVFKTQENFVACPKCQRIYWQGTHWGNVEATLREIMKNPKSQ